MLSSLLQFTLGDEALAILRSAGAQAPLAPLSDNIQSTSRFTYALMRQRQLGDISSQPALPRHIMQFWDTHIIPEDVRECMRDWEALPGIAYTRFDDAGARDFITTTYGAELATAYDFCYHPAMRADYFRLAYLLRHGGAYIDADERLRSLERLNEIFAAPAALTMHPLIWHTQTYQMSYPDFLAPFPFDGLNKYYFANSPLFCAPGNRAIEIALQRATAAIFEGQRRNIKLTIHLHTGPDNTTAALFHSALEAHLHGAAPTPFAMLTHWEQTAYTPALAYKNTQLHWLSAARIYGE